MGIWVKYNADAGGLMLDEDAPMPMNAKNVVESSMDGGKFDDGIGKLIVLLAIALGII